jgi:hypothetical protein
MRLNRVLLLAATINILIFALAFTISCSGGEDGPRGRDADHCIIDDNWDIVCTSAATGKSDLVGRLDGGDGPTGEPGEVGDQGDGCKLGDKVENSYQVLCGPKGSEEVKGILDGCQISVKGEVEVDITCGATEVGICSGLPFNTDTYYCEIDANGKGKIEEVDETDFEECGGVQINTKKQYCGFSEKSAEKDTPYKICGTSAKPNEDAWNREYCRYVSEKVAVASNDYCNNLPINKDSWQTQYCGYANKDASTKTLQKNICDNPGTAVYRYGSSGAGGAVLINTPVYGPNEIAFGQGYCEVRWPDRFTGKTTYSERKCGLTGKVNENKWQKQYCGYGKESDSIPTTIFNDICDDGTRPSAKGLQVFEIASSSNDPVYIAYGNVYNATHYYTHDGAIRVNAFVSGTDTTTLASSGEYSSTFRVPGFNYEQGGSGVNFRKYYCGYLNAKGTTKVPGITGTTTLPACPVITKSGSNWKITYKQPNKDKYNGDYCGMKPGTATTGTYGTANNTDPTASNYNPIGDEFGGFGGTGTLDKDTPNFLKNAKKFLISSTVDTLYTGAKVESGGKCDDGRAAFMYRYASQGTGNPNSGLVAGQTWNGYCKYDATSRGTVLTTGNATSSNDFCGYVAKSDGSGTEVSGKPIPKGSYCGYKSAADFNANPKKKSVISGACPGDDLARGPHYDGYNMGFCGYETASSTTTKYFVKCNEKTTYNEKSYNYDYCGYEEQAAAANSQYPSYTAGSTPAYVGGTKVYTKGLCSDFRGKYDYITASSGNDATEGKWEGYCQASNENGSTTLVPSYGAPGSKAQAGIHYCATGTIGSEKYVKLNENTWKGEYCVGSSGIGFKTLQCKGGQVPSINCTNVTSCTTTGSQELKDIICVKPTN